MRALPQRPLCKIISGIGGRDLARVQRLASLYALAGADWLDVALDPAVVEAAMAGLQWAQAHAARPLTMRIMVSCGLPDDPHVGAALLDTSVCATCTGCVIPELLTCVQRPLAERSAQCPACQACIGACPYGAIRVAPALAASLPQLAACLRAGATGVELHVAGASAVAADRALSELLPQLPAGALLSVSVGADVHALGDLLAVCRTAAARQWPAWLVQVEGPAMQTEQGPGDAQAIALVQELQRLAPDLPIQLAGGCDSETARRCVAAGLRLVGLGFGGQARRCVADALGMADFSADAQVFQAALQRAEVLVASVQALPAAGSRMTHGWPLRPSILTSAPYRTSYTPKSPGEIKLNHNESPTDVDPALKAEVCARLAETPWHRYADSDGRALRAALASATGQPAAGIAVGHGANDVLQRLLAALGPTTTLVTVEPDYYVPGRAAEVLGVPVRRVALQWTGDGFALPTEALLEAGRTTSAVLVLSQPNNPTGTLYAEAEIDRLLAEFCGLIVLDEAYAEFAGVSRAGDLAGRPNLAILRTMSKAHGLAGVRVGYLLADPALVEHLDKLSPPYPIGVLTSVAAEVAISHPDLATARVAEVVTERARVSAALAAVGIQVLPSAASFLLCALGPQRARALRFLADAGLAVRDVGQVGPLAGCLRISIGTPEANDRAVAALRSAMQDS